MRVRLNVYFPPTLAKQVDELAIRRRISRSPLPDEDQAAAQVKGRKRYEGFIETLGRRYASGKSLLDEIGRDIAPQDDSTMDRTSDSTPSASEIPPSHADRR